ncbi:MAG: hypothetical protein SFH39_02285 [Candidatus Magnetobacterium sp. LHC-1]|uniref:Transposase n=1 Tax=Candidatus Magnetobacterium casense TaxID=1455061 RepID=A0ABS6RZS1_9BACT|nr:hypothetical protein [Candidatus Magnetobacterium casensis]MBF0607763.1 hypothetical protein [Nitrospirota bacterium]MBV6342106.1 hypothetical protein [Candidatus Magnetobacterium casensis]
MMELNKDITSALENLLKLFFDKGVSTGTAGNVVQCNSSNTGRGKGRAFGKSGGRQCGCP